MIFVLLMICTVVAVAASRMNSLDLFVADFIVLLMLAGAGNGSTYKMIPAIFQAKALQGGADGETRLLRARRLSNALIGVTGALGALGGVFINLAFRVSFAGWGSGVPAFIGFLVFYAACAAVTWTVYLRRGPPGRAARGARPHVVLSV